MAVDVIPLAEVAERSGHLNVNHLLQHVAPSFNANRQSGADGSDHIDPAALRGLGPDQTLVLINGKRRHQSSLINIFGSRGRGNTGTDLNAIRTVEYAGESNEGWATSLSFAYFPSCSAYPAPRTLYGSCGVRKKKGLTRS